MQIDVSYTLLTKRIMFIACIFILENYSFAEQALEITKVNKNTIYFIYHLTT